MKWIDNRGSNYIFVEIDVVLPNPGRQRVMVACVPSDEILAAAAAGPGTTLGAPQ